MPGQFERHSRNAWEWGPVPARSDLVRQSAADDPEPVKRPPGKKDTRSWCKGKTGVPHRIQLVRVAWRPGGSTACGWVPGYVHRRGGIYEVTWSCCHQEQCSRCGRHFRWRLKPQECPDWPGTPEQRTAAQAKADQATARRREWLATFPRYRKPVITGPQGYRKPKGGS
jgi:hypothetical protein